MDDWELSSEELDSLDREALKQLAERHCSSSAATTSFSNGNRLPTVSPQPSNVPSARSPAKPTFHLRPPLDNNKINTSHQARKLPTSVAPKMIDNSPKPQHPKITVKLFLHASGNVAARFPYDKVLFPNEAVVMLLARMIGMLGPFDMEMLQNGLGTHKFFMEEYDLY